jgi:hypothetical protein
MDSRIKVGFEAVVEHRRLEGFPARLGDDCAYLGLGQVAVVAKVMQLSGNGNVHAAVLWVGLRLRDGGPSMFFDVVDNYGSSQDEAVVQTMLSWLHGVLPPILPLIGGSRPSNVEVFGRGSKVDIPPWIINAGPYQASGLQQEHLARALSASPPLLQVDELIRRKARPARLHWLKLYRCRNPETGLDLADCFWDSALEEEGVKLLMAWVWPEIPGRHSFRRFFVLVPEGWPKTTSSF